MSTLKVVKGLYLWKTLQGEGRRVGEPSIFLRLHGCDFSCSWCDTKDSWRPGSEYEEIEANALRQKIFDEAPSNFGLVITGGNPLLQADALLKVFDPEGGERGLSRRSGPVTLETQGTWPGVSEKSVIALMGFVDLLSVSPKLDRWDWGFTRLIDEIEGWARWQVKLVPQGPEDFSLMRLNIATLIAKYESELHDEDGIIYIQPEFSKGRRLVEECTNFALRVTADTGVPVRVLTQVHKKGLYVV